MNKKAVLLLVSACLLVALALYCQDDFEAWQKKQAEKFRQYKSAQDKAFVEFLEKNWEPYKTFTGEKIDTTPKPETPPVADVTTEPELPQGNTVEDIVVPKLEEQVEKNSMLVAVDKAAPVVKIDFWGLPLEYNFQPNLEVNLEPLNEQAVANFWYVVSNTDFEKLLQQLQESRAKMNLNDWGYCLLVNELGKNISHNSVNIKRLFIWFVLTKSGYECKVGYGEGSVYLLIPSANKIYGVTYVEMNGKRYYAITFEGNEKLDFAINTYDGKYPDADALIDLEVTESPRINTTIVEKELTFSYNGNTYKIPVRYDKNAAEFFRQYPQTNLDVYFNAPLSPEATQSLTMGLKPILEGKSEAEAANIILRFVQTAFKYETDGDQFGREKSFFADETLFYPYCDCEDRSIIFAHLIKQILNRQVVGLDYPGHIATGVNFVTRIDGDFVMVDNKVFTVCDPTYINADIGMAMPDFQAVQPQIIDFTKK
ncbi:MAG TPA: hypothetical protein PLD62_04660 [Candidatus Cloacimonadota bacterium]|nr:hypothetical protein [Candidatus Cloacimonadota bacterium]